MTDKNWPAWFNGPNGEAEIFNSADEVPNGWTTGAEKRPAPKPKQPTPPASSPVTEDAGLGVQVDAHGWPWSADLHAVTRNLTKEGLWRMKVGVTRPDPKPGFPAAAQPLDL